MGEYIAQPTRNFCRYDPGGIGTSRRLEKPAGHPAGRFMSESNINQFAVYNFLCPVADIVHASYPFKLVPGFQFLGHSFSGFHLLYDKVKPFLRLLVQVGKVCP